MSLTPIYKKCDSRLPENQRPISITAALSTIFERLLMDQIIDYLHINKLISSTHFGTTIDALAYYTEYF